MALLAIFLTLTDSFQSQITNGKITNLKGPPPPPATKRLPGDYRKTTSSAFRGNALLWYSRRIPGVFQGALQSFSLPLYCLYAFPTWGCLGSVGLAMDQPNALNSRSFGLTCPGWPWIRG